MGGAYHYVVLFLIHRKCRKKGKVGIIVGVTRLLVHQTPPTHQLPLAPLMKKEVDQSSLDSGQETRRKGRGKNGREEVTEGESERDVRDPEVAVEKGAYIYDVYV